MLTGPFPVVFGFSLATKRRTQNSRRRQTRSRVTQGQAGRNMSNVLPVSTPIELALYSTLTSPGTNATSFDKGYTVANFTGDFTTAPQYKRSVAFSRFVVDMAPVYRQMTTTVNPQNGFGVELFGVNPESGELITLTGVKAMSMTNPTRISCRTPPWLTQAWPVTSATTLVHVRITTFTNAGFVVPTTFGLTIRGYGRITPDAPQFV